MPVEQLTVLLVEDNDIDVQAVRRAFRKYKIDNPLVVAHDGAEALRKLRGQDADTVAQPYLILLDLHMPGMDGLKFLDELRRDPILRRSIVFVLTTSEDDRDKSEAFDRCVAGYISKTDVTADFLKVIGLIEQLRITIHFPPIG